MKRLTQNRTILIARILFAACVIGAAVNLVIWGRQLTGPPSLFEAVEVIGWSTAITLVFSFLGLLIINRQPDNRVGWMMMFTGVATMNPASWIVDALTAPPNQINAGLWFLLWLDSWSWIPVIFPLFLIPLHFPTGHPPSPRWNWVNRLAFGMWLFFIIFLSFVKEIGPLNGKWITSNPIGIIPMETVEKPFSFIWTVGLFTLVIVSVLSLFIRYRHASDSVRLQIKWLLYAAIFFAVVYIFFSGEDSPLASGIQNLLFVLSVLAIPASIAIAILRYRLYDIDILIRRTLVYSLLTGLLGLVYFGGVTLLQGILTADSVGYNDGVQTAVSRQPSAIIIVATTLAIAALFNPLRRRLQEIIDRRFYRQKYDAEKALAEFATTTRASADTTSLSNHLVGLVSRTLQPDSLQLWITSIPQNTSKEKIK